MRKKRANRRIKDGEKGFTMFKCLAHENSIQMKFETNCGWTLSSATTLAATCNRIRTHFPNYYYVSIIISISCQWSCESIYDAEAYKFEIWWDVGIDNPSNWPISRFFIFFFFNFSIFFFQNHTCAVTFDFIIDK